MNTNLLIVDDSELIRTSLRAVLGSVPGITNISEATTLDEALNSARRNPPTFIILDLTLPDGMGMNIIEPLKRIAPAVLIAVLTIHTEAAFRKLCKVLGADCFFDKATEIDALLEAVRQHVALNAPIHSDGEGLRA